MGELLCLYLSKGKCLHSHQLCTALGQISALTSSLQVVQSISHKPSCIFGAQVLTCNMEILSISVVPVWWWLSSHLHAPPDCSVTLWDTLTLLTCGDDPSTFRKDFTTLLQRWEIAGRCFPKLKQLHFVEYKCICLV